MIPGDVTIVSAVLLTLQAARVSFIIRRMEKHAVSRPLGSWACPLPVLPPLGLGIVPCNPTLESLYSRSVAVLTGRAVPDVPALAGSIDGADKPCQESALQTGGFYSMQSRAAPLYWRSSVQLPFSLTTSSFQTTRRRMTQKPQLRGLLWEDIAML